MIWRLTSHKWWHLIGSCPAYVNIIRMKLACHYKAFLFNFEFLCKGISAPRIQAFIVKPDQVFSFIALTRLQATARAELQGNQSSCHLCYKMQIFSQSPVLEVQFYQKFL